MRHLHSWLLSRASIEISLPQTQQLQEVPMRMVWQQMGKVPEGLT